MSGILKACRRVCGPCCGSKGERRTGDRRTSAQTDSEDEGECWDSSGAYQKMTAVDNQLIVPGGPDGWASNQGFRLSVATVVAGSESEFVVTSAPCPLPPPAAAAPKPPPTRKARRKEKDSGSGPSSGGPGSSDEGKLYLETALLERHLNETELQRMVLIPNGFEENEWMASHTISLFEHVNLIYGTISEFCTSTSCPDMTGPCMRTYLWFDEKGKKVKVAAPQYVDYVMTFIQKTINDESIFPTKSTNAFPSSFKPIVKKICRLMFHVIAHIYHCHFKEIVLLCLHAHLNCVFAHFTIFNESFKLVDEKETEILQDLSLAMKLRSDLVVVDDDPMGSESNKENIGLSKSSSGRVMFPPTAADAADSVGTHRTGDTSTSSASTFISTTDDGLLIKDPALVSSASESH